MAKIWATEANMRDYNLSPSDYVCLGPFHDLFFLHRTDDSMRIGGAFLDMQVLDLVPSFGSPFVMKEIWTRI